MEALEDSVLGGHNKMVALKDDVRITSLPTNLRVAVSEAEAEILEKYKVLVRREPY